MSYSPRELKTKRLILRQFHNDDWQALHEHYSDTECTKVTFQRALTKVESWRAMCRSVGHWQIRGYGPFAVVDAASGQVIGAIGLWYPNDWLEPEIKWALLRRFLGRGCAAEAARAVQMLAMRHLGGAALSIINAD